MNPSVSFSSASQNQAQNDVNHDQTNLLDVDEVIRSGDIELLAQQLRAAHQMLNFKTELADSLTDQLHCRNTSAVQIQDENTLLRQQCETQQVELTELRSICADLRALLKRQQRRMVAKPALSSQSLKGGHVFDLTVLPTPSCQSKDISLGYESHREPVMLAASTKAPPVKAWSATQAEGLHGEESFCQKLTTFIVASSTLAPLASAPKDEVPLRRSQSVMTSSPVQLPQFAAG